MKADVVAVCKNCGSGDHLYRDVEITTDAWEDIHIDVAEGGRFEVHPSGDYEEGPYFWDDAVPRKSGGCSACGTTWFKLEDGVCVKDVACPNCEGDGCHRCGYVGTIDPTEPFVHPDQGVLAA